MLDGVHPNDHSRAICQAVKHAQLTQLEFTVTLAGGSRPSTHGNSWLADDGDDGADGDGEADDGGRPHEVHEAERARKAGGHPAARLELLHGTRSSAVRSTSACCPALAARYLMRTGGASHAVVTDAVRLRTADDSRYKTEYLHCRYMSAGLQVLIAGGYVALGQHAKKCGPRHAAVPRVHMLRVDQP
jgi:hypothetical protein